MDDEMEGPSKAEREKWQAEDDLRTLVRAAEIKKDKARTTRAMALAKKQMAELEKVQKA